MDLDKTLKTTTDLNLPKSSILTLILIYFKAIKRLFSTTKWMDGIQNINLKYILKLEENKAHAMGGYWGGYCIWDGGPGPSLPVKKNQTF